MKTELSLDVAYISVHGETEQKKRRGTRLGEIEERIEARDETNVERLLTSLSCVSIELAYTLPSSS